MSMMAAGAAAWRRSGGDIPFDPIAAAILAKLTSWWELSEASGTRADSHGGNDLSPAGTVATAQGVRGPGDVAAAFSGAGTLGIPAVASMQVPAGGGDHCLFGWYYAESTGGSQGFFSRWNSSSAAALEYYARVESGNAQFLNGGSAYRVASTPATAGQWQFFVGWRDSADGYPRVQVSNGPIADAGAESNPTVQSHASTLGGSSSSFNRMTGRLQRWGWIKGGILTPAERAWLYNGGSGRTYAEIVSAASP